MDASEDEPIVLLLPELLLPPEVLGVLADEEPVEGDEAEEPDELVDGVVLEPLAPMEVPLPDVPVLALGVLLLELPLALGVELLELPEALGDELEPAVELLVSVLLLLEGEGALGDVVLEDALGEVAEAPAVPPLVPPATPPLAPPLWATATPPNARAAAAASVERVILVARMCLTPR